MLIGRNCRKNVEIKSDGRNKAPVWTIVSTAYKQEVDQNHQTGQQYQWGGFVLLLLRFGELEEYPAQAVTLDPT